MDIRQYYLRQLPKRRGMGEIFEILMRKATQKEAWKALGLEYLYDVLTDPAVTDIHFTVGRPFKIARMGEKYIDQVICTENFFDRLKNHCEYHTGYSLNPLSPDIKAGFTTPLGNLRVSLQMPPLSDSEQGTIRRLPFTAISLENLIEIGQIGMDVADELVGLLLDRKNIVIAGEPGSGKTTLANALLEKSPSFWRVVIMEDAQEIRLSNHPFSVRYNIPPTGVHNSPISRPHEIARLLHRSPDYAFLGEIQTKEDTMTTFEAFAAGVAGMATTHARNFESLMLRWKNSHNLPVDLLAAIDAVVMTKKSFLENKSMFKVQAITYMEEYL